ncbi:MAG TPA: methylenetetrahydrofolate reductase [Solirubrobacteraceae bacterium]|nr:methylenetetrahydrofolate reductase [Solirubrobacteraceae bacterium]
MSDLSGLSADIDPTARFEVLPLARAEGEAQQLQGRVRLTVTCSPKHGPDHSVQFAARLRELGHAVTVHIAARMVRDRAHLDELLGAMAQASIDDLFLVGGDADPPLGAYGSAAELLGEIAGHPQRPAAVGITGYPEGHPLIDEQTLQRALLDKAAMADYVTTQMCFDPRTLRGWIEDQRRRGLRLPVQIGMPGQVAATRLLEMSARIGVGPSMAFLRKQRGPRALLGLVRRSAPERLYRALAPEIGGSLGIAGFHYFTFNQLQATVAWHRAHAPAPVGAAPSASGPARAQFAEQSRT